MSPGTAGGGQAGEDPIREARESDIETLSRVLARSFDDDPISTWMFPEEASRRRRSPHLFAALIRTAMPLGEVYTTASRRGAAIWNPPGTFPMGWRTNARMGLTIARLLRSRVLVCASGLMYFDLHHPREPHWYLQILGTDPEWQGKGVGSALLAQMLERCDTTGERVYLEASKEKNIGFYERHGFSVSQEIRVPRGPTVWAMWRDPR